MLLLWLYGGRLIQIAFKLCTLDQHAVAVHDIEILVRVLVNQHPKLSFADMIISGGFFNRYRIYRRQFCYRDLFSFILVRIDQQDW